MTDMRWGAVIALTLMTVAPLGAAPHKAAPHKIAPTVLAVPKLIQSCDAHKFETIVDAVVDDQPRKSKVKLCGVEGQSDADWIGTLRDAIRKLEANKDMAAATRDQIVAAIKTEIARLSIIGPQAPAKRENRAETAPLLSRDYAALPPLPAAPAAATTVPASVTAAPSPAPAVTIAGPIAVAALPAVAPRLTINCETPGDLGGPAPCAEFEQETRLIIRADEDMPPGTVLQFIRNGRARGELSLAGLGKGSTLRAGLPRSVCSGFGAGRLELRISSAGGTEVPHSDGPYTLRC